MPSTEPLDLVVIGSGPAGERGTAGAAHFGPKGRSGGGSTDASIDADSIPTLAESFKDAAHDHLQRLARRRAEGGVADVGMAREPSGSRTAREFRLV
jgi:hypothetical protein